MNHNLFKLNEQSELSLCLMNRVKRLVPIVLLISAVISLAACQATPKTPPVVNKQQGIEQKVENNTQGSNSLMGLPQTVKDNIVSGGITLSIDAQLEVPQTTVIPVVNVKPEQFTQDTVDKVVKTFIQGKQLYKPSDVRSKQELQKLYVLQQAMQLPGNSDEETNNNSRSAGAGAGSLDPASWQKDIDSAPETVKKTPITGKLTDSNENDLVIDGKTYKGFHGQMLNAVADLGAGSGASLKVFTAYSGKNCEIQFTNRDITHVYKYSELTSNARGMKTTLDEAEKLAQDTLNTLGVSDLKLSGVQLGTRIPLTKGEDPNKTNQAYGLWFTRNVNDVTTTLDLTDTHLEDAKTYHYERVFMLIDDAGVIEFNWYSPMRQTGTISANAKILSFDDIMSTFKKQFPIHYAQAGSNKGNVTYKINRITIGMMRVQVKNQADQYMMVPVWDFYGTGDATDHTLKSFLTINAIDGSVIDRTLGY